MGVSVADLLKSSHRETVYDFKKKKKKKELYRYLFLITEVEHKILIFISIQCAASPVTHKSTLLPLGTVVFSLMVCS